MMTLKERALYHQIHPLKLGTDILASIVSLYFFWQHELLIALALHFLPPIIMSALLVRYAMSRADFGDDFAPSPSSTLRRLR